ncbi:alpha/beta hydrolase family protein [Lysobacter tyrosinilyticus]
MANEFATMGLPCLRFDFHGTGDSSGEGEALDFASMQRDLDVAVTALRERTGIERLALVAWRGSALAVEAWLQRGGNAELVVLWEPIVDGAGWLQEMLTADIGERASRPPPRPGVPRMTDPSDGQLMGFPASRRLREDLEQSQLHGGQARRTPIWAVVRSDAGALPLPLAKVLSLPAGAPSFHVGAAMDATFFLTPSMRELVSELGQAMRKEAFA